MLNLALVALLSGSLLTGSTDDDCKKDQTCEQDQVEATVGLSDDERPIVNDSYAYGRTAASAPVKLWVEYAMGGVDQVYLPNGSEVDLNAVSAGAQELNARRLAVGLQLNVVNTSSFSFGVGGELSVAKDEIETLSAESAFGMQNVKIFGVARGRVAGIHGGYILDLADEPTDEEPLSTTDLRDAIFFGADFDYPSDNFRLFGGADVFMLQDPDAELVEGEAVADDDTNIMIATMGAGLRFSIFELGAALIIRSRIGNGLINDSGNHHGSVAPYLRISPPSLPVSAFIKGAVANEYTDYGYAIGGGNEFKAGLGFTAGLSIGFE